MEQYSNFSDSSAYHDTRSWLLNSGACFDNLWHGKVFFPCNATSCLLINVQGLQFDSMRTTEKMFALVLYGVLRIAETSLKWKMTRAFCLRRTPSWVTLIGFLNSKSLPMLGVNLDSSLHQWCCGNRGIAMSRRFDFYFKKPTVAWHWVRMHTFLEN